MKVDLSPFKSCRILITGGAGFVGSNLTRIILRDNKNVKITIIDNLLSSDKTSIPIDKRIEFIKSSITNNKTLNGLEDRYDYIFHLATFHGNQNSILIH